MMALTHGLASLALVALATPALSEYAGPPLLAAAFFGGMAPDLDLVAEHRKSLHFPVGYTLLAAIFTAWAAVSPSPGVLLCTVAVGAAALHAWSDVLAGSVEPAPWNPTSEQAVYNHALGRWHRPRRLVRYSGAPEDGLLAVGLAAVALLTPATGPTADAALLWLLVVAGAYVLARKRLTELRSRLAALTPAWVVASFPVVSVEETESGATRIALRRR
ncbi:metal-dependent hydrolase [Halorientalis pallida]|uniref:Metal-dependent hydrolase n=2 Tax=Halorientalis pallida TaxID=2479928 RepID=A0A498KTM4_9EURY|nr:metal-dependent hydrolase [Halorientalis pallida]